MNPRVCVNYNKVRFLYYDIIYNKFILIDVIIFYILYINNYINKSKYIINRNYFAFINFFPL